MSTRLDSFAPTVISTLRYRDLKRATEWLCRAFGFETHNFAGDGEGGVLYSELSFGTSTIVLTSAGDPQLRGLMTQPDEIGGAETQICYLVVDDVDSYYNRAKAAGAAFVSDVAADDSGNRSFTCRDLEGHIWTFGTYAPSRPQALRTGPAHLGRGQRPGLWELNSRRWGAAAAATAMAALLVWFCFELKSFSHREAVSSVAAAAAPPVGSALQAEQPSGNTAAGMATGEPVRLVQARPDRVMLEQVVQEAHAQLAHARAAEEAAEHAATQAQTQLAEEHTHREALVQAVRGARAQLAQERAGKEAAARSSSTKDLGTSNDLTSAPGSPFASF
jgi:uncharacterized glyoxalase superfamily protein PhnB